MFCFLAWLLNEKSLIEQWWKILVIKGLQHILAVFYKDSKSYSTVRPFINSFFKAPPRSCLLI